MNAEERGDTFIVARVTPGVQCGRASAIRQPVLQAPAPVIAKALGYHGKTATRLVTESGGTWSRYAPATTHGDTRTGLTPHRGIRDTSTCDPTSPNALVARGRIGWTVNVDSTICWTHQHAAGARRDGHAQRKGPLESRGSREPR
jgi:hypothetical protein